MRLAIASRVSSPVDTDDERRAHQLRTRGGAQPDRPLREYDHPERQAPH